LWIAEKKRVKEREMGEKKRKITNKSKKRKGFNHLRPQRKKTMTERKGVCLSACSITVRYLRVERRHLGK